jgi:hypothetical protein
VTLVEADGGTEHTSLEEWLKQRSQFEHISRLRFFRTFLTRRSFVAWRRSSARSSLTSRAELLKSTSFVGMTAFQAALLSARAQILDLKFAPLLGIDPLRTYSLEAWQETAAAALDAALPRLAAVLRHLQRLADNLEQKFKRQIEAAYVLLNEPPPALVLSKLTAFRQEQEVRIQCAKERLARVGSFHRMTLHMFVQHCITIAAASFRYELASIVGWRSTSPSSDLRRHRRSTHEASAVVSRFSSRRTSVSSTDGLQQKRRRATHAEAGAPKVGTQQSQREGRQNGRVTLIEARDTDSGSGSDTDVSDGDEAEAKAESEVQAAPNATPRSRAHGERRTLEAPFSLGAVPKKRGAWSEARTLGTLSELSEIAEDHSPLTQRQLPKLTAEESDAEEEEEPGPSLGSNMEKDALRHEVVLRNSGGADSQADEGEDDEAGAEGEDVEDEPWSLLQLRMLHRVNAQLLRECVGEEPTARHTSGLLCVKFTLDPVSARAAADPVYEHLQESVDNSMGMVIRALCALLLSDAASLQGTANMASIEAHLSRRLTEASAAGLSAEEKRPQDAPPVAISDVELPPSSLVWTSRTQEGEKGDSPPSHVIGALDNLAPLPQRGLACFLDTFLCNSDAYEETRQLLYDRLLEAYADVVGMVMQYEWVEEVALFVRDWNDDVLLGWRGRCHLLYELQGQLQLWATRLKTVPVSRISSNSVLRLDSLALKRDLLPRLLAISRDLDGVLNDRIASDADEVLSLAMQQIKALRNEANMTHPTSTEYAKVVEGAARARAMLPELQAKMGTVEELVSVKRRIFSELQQGQDTLATLNTIETEVKSRWSELNSMLAAAEQLIKVLAPTMTRRLKQKLAEQEIEAQSMQALLASGMFTHPFSRSARVLTRLFQASTRLQQLKSQSEELRAALELIDEQASPGKEVDKVSLAAQDEDFRSFSGRIL